MDKGPHKVTMFPIVMYKCESWTIKKAKCWRIDAFKLWSWRRLKVPWTERKSNQSILKEIRLMLKLKLQYFGHLMQRANSLEKTLMRERLRRGWQDETVGGITITNSMDMSLSKFCETVKDKEAWHAADLDTEQQLKKKTQPSPPPKEKKNPTHFILVIQRPYKNHTHLLIHLSGPTMPKSPVTNWVISFFLLCGLRAEVPFPSQPVSVCLKFAYLSLIWKVNGRKIDKIYFASVHRCRVFAVVFYLEVFWEKPKWRIQ